MRAATAATAPALGHFRRHELTVQVDVSADVELARLELDQLRERIQLRCAGCCSGNLLQRDMNAGGSARFVSARQGATFVDATIDIDDEWYGTSGHPSRTCAQAADGASSEPDASVVMHPS
jgi:hypothetical protein